MKTIIITAITLFLGVLNINIQEGITLKANYDGYYEGIYSFTIITDDEDYFGETIEFSEVSKEILKKYDLTSEEFIDEEFTITYSEEITIENEEENNKLIDIKK